MNDETGGHAVGTGKVTPLALCSFRLVASFRRNGSRHPIFRIHAPSCVSVFSFPFSVFPDTRHPDTRKLTLQPQRTHRPQRAQEFFYAPKARSVFSDTLLLLSTFLTGRPSGAYCFRFARIATDGSLLRSSLAQRGYFADVIDLFSVFPDTRYPTPDT